MYSKGVGQIQRKVCQRLVSIDCGCSFCPGVPQSCRAPAAGAVWQACLAASAQSVCNRPPSTLASWASETTHLSIFSLMVFTTLPPFSNYKLQPAFNFFFFFFSLTHILFSYYPQKVTLSFSKLGRYIDPLSSFLILFFPGKLPLSLVTLPGNASAWFV